MLLATYVTLHTFLGDLHRQATESASPAMRTGRSPWNKP